MINVGKTEMLQRWFSRNLEKTKDEMYYKNGMGAQVMFVRDTLTGLLARSQLEYQRIPRVAAEHRFKSVQLPVYYFDLPWAQLWLRGNFYDWNLSVASKMGPLHTDIEGLCSTITPGCFFQGFHPDWQFDSWEADQSRFSCSPSSDFQLYTLLFLLKRDAMKAEPDFDSIHQQIREVLVVAKLWKERLSWEQARGPNWYMDKTLTKAQRRFTGYDYAQVVESKVQELANSPGMANTGDIHDVVQALFKAGFINPEQHGFWPLILKLEELAEN